MPEYEMINYATGEVETFETVLDLSILKAYNDWVVEKKLNPPTFSPEEFAREMEDLALRVKVEEALSYLVKYSMAETVPSDIVKHAIDILKGEK
jgi:hypothetical protein